MKATSVRSRRCQLMAVLLLVMTLSCESTRTQQESTQTPPQQQTLPDSIPPPTPMYDSTRPVVNPDTVSQSKVIEKKPKKKSNNAYDAYKIEVRTFQEGTQGWGYDILLNGEPHIHQPHIPAVSGNQGFKSEAAARKAANLIVWKMKHNIMPPSISTEELDSLGVL
jgi:hypothetical protein